MGEQIRFTPDEIKALMSNGELSMGLLQKMHPDDVKVAQSMMNAGDYETPPMAKDHRVQALGGAALAVPLAAGGALPAGASAIAGELPMMAKVAGYTGLAALGAKMGVPASAMEAVALYLGMKGGMNKLGGAAAPAAEAEAQTLEQELLKRGINPKAASAAESYTATRRNPFGPAKTPPLMEHGPARIPPLAEHGPVPRSPADVEASIFGAAPKAAYSPNVSTQSNWDDLVEMLTGSSHGQGTPEGSPMQYADPSLRSSIDTLKRATRRKPR